MASKVALAHEEVISTFIELEREFERLRRKTQETRDEVRLIGAPSEKEAAVIHPQE